ncbi:MAG: hypothetical protein SFW67_35670 [Myxococcaceae bacterium]|nr:hypothetical protein [Myxococcaceae bacterium]
MPGTGFDADVTSLFGATFAPADVSEMRVHRAKVATGSIEGLITAGVIGLSPTTVSITLADGRTFKTGSRGSGKDHEPLERVVSALRAHRLALSRRQLALGERLVFGDVTLSSRGVEVNGRSYAWDDIVGHRLRLGWWLFDTSGGLAGEVPVGSLPWGDVFIALVFERLGDKDYAQQTASQWPSFGFLRLTASTRIPGTWRYQLHFFFGLVVLAVLGGLVFGAASLLRRAGYAEDARQRRVQRDAGFTAAVTSIRSGAPLPACAPAGATMLWRVIDVEQQRPRELQGVGHASTAASVLYGGGEFFVWGVVDREVRVARWDRVVSCLSKAPAGTDAEATAFSLITYGVEATLARTPPPPPAPPEPGPPTFDDLLRAQSESVKPWAIGDAVRVTWKDQPWDATIIKVFSQKKVRVHYDGWSKKWDETISVSRIVGRR